ncbi:signal recognition particle protein [bacterium]|nr:signal recognition particle protein [bacterium]
MFGELTEKLEGFFSGLKGRGKLTEDNVRESLRDVRRILLEADVNFAVARDFLKRVEEKAVGVDVLKSVTPAQQVIKILHDELTELLGGNFRPLKRSKETPTVIMMVGLQGSGKTTTTGKLGHYLRSHGMRPMLAACDMQRPAAIDQLERIGEQSSLTVHAKRGVSALEAALAAKEAARLGGQDTLIVDTAGRLHVDEELMNELRDLRDQLHPSEILFVADGMTGQDAVNSAKAFTEQLDITGVVMTKLDGDARGGAALSVREVSGAPIRFAGIGEKIEEFEEFHPDRMANRILGLGDVVTLVEKAQASLDLEQAEKLAKKLKKADFDLEDFLGQLRQVSNMGPLEGLMKLIPGAGKALKGVEIDDREIKRTEAIILSMTPEERRKPGMLNGSRRRRIAMGSGTSVQDVNRLLNQFDQMRKLFKKMGGNKKGLMRGMPFPPA